MNRDTGETETFEAFFRSEYSRLVRVIHALCGDYQRAEDLVQESMSLAHRAWDDVGGYDAPAAWVRRVALNRVANLQRSRSREAAAVARLNPAERTNVVELYDGDLWRAVGELPRQQRWAVVLFYVADAPIADIAAVLECSAGSVKTHLSRARQTLSDDLRPSEELE